MFIKILTIQKKGQKTAFISWCILNGLLNIKAESFFFFFNVLKEKKFDKVAKPVYPARGEFGLLSIAGLEFYNVNSGVNI